MPQEQGADMKHEPTDRLAATSESKRLDSDIDEDFYPKRFTIEVRVHPDDPGKVLVDRLAENMGAFELYGLLTAVRDAVRAQMTFPESQRSDGIVVSRAQKETE